MMSSSPPSTSAGDVIFASHGVRSMSHMAWQAAVNTSSRFESRRICWQWSTIPWPASDSSHAFETACQEISSARMRLPGPSGSRRAMSIQFLKMSRPARPSFAAAQLMTTDVVRPHLHVVVLQRFVGSAVAAHVEVDHLEALRQRRRRRIEVVVAEPGPVDLDHRLALPRDAVPEVDAVDLDQPFHGPSSVALQPSITDV